MAMVRTNRLAAGKVDVAAQDSRLRYAAKAGTSGDSTSALTSPRSTGAFVWTCPSGYRGILRHIDLATDTIPAPPDIMPETFYGFALWGIQLGAGPFVLVGMTVLTSLAITCQWDGVAVFHPGDQLWVECSIDGPLFYQASGALLIDQ